MTNKLTTIKFHGKFGKFMGKEFKAKISSVKEAFRAVDCLSGRRFTRFFLEDKSNLEADYRVLVNGKEIATSDKKIDSFEKAKNSELVVKNNNIETIDIIPVIKGGQDFMSIITIVIGAIIAVIGAWTGNPALIMVGVGLIMAGVMNLLAEPPQFDDFVDPGKKAFGQSYLFDGPKSTAGEGGPVPLGYGRLLVGGVAVTATYETVYKDGRINILGS